MTPFAPSKPPLPGKAIARQHRLPILSRDTHFDLVEDLERISW